MIWTSDPRALAAAQRAFEERGPRPREAPAFALLVALGAILVALLTFGVNAAGEEAPEDPPRAPRRATIEHAGEVGVWFRADVAREMLADLEELPLLRTRVSLLEERLELRDSQVERLRRVVDLAQEGERIALEGLENALAARREAEEGARVWWRSPTLWLSVGVVLTAGLVALTAYALSAVPGG